MSFQQFIKERQYLHNVSPATVEWYKHSFKWLRTESPSQDELKDAVLRMREKGLKATGCNSAIRAINAYLKWSCLPLKIPQLKEPQIVLPTFTTAQVKILVNWKSRTFYQRRLHLLVLMLLDTGCRISELLSLRVQDCDLDNLLFTINGKGLKQRRIPFSFELRKNLVRYTIEFCPQPYMLILGTKNGCKLSRRVMLRNVKALCDRLGIVPPNRTLHAFRHTFAVNYLRRGGSVFHLQKVLGHSTLEMTRRYANLLTEDLQAMHQRVSLLAN